MQELPIIDITKFSEIFDERWIACRLWPPHSSDFNVLCVVDYLCNTLKVLVYVSCPYSFQELSHGKKVDSFLRDLGAGVKWT